MANLEKDLGFIQAIFVSTTPPINTKQIWFDDNVGQKVHKVYNVILGMWVLLAPNVGQGFRVYSEPNTTATSIIITQVMHTVIEVANVQILEYLPIPDDFYQVIDLPTENIVYRIYPNQDIEIDNPLGLMLQIKVSGRA